MKNKKSPASNQKASTPKENPVHNTSGAIMPDVDRPEGQNEKDVQEAFGSDVGTKTSKRDR